MCDEPSGFLVLDTNVWVYTTRLLRTGLGAALLHSIRQTKIAIALPEVIELEIRKHVVKHGGDAVASIKDDYHLIEQLLGVRDDYQVPSIDAFAQQVDIRLLELEELITRIPFTVQHAKDALNRVIDESPPNGPKNQQFKDSAIWEAILKLAKKGSVTLVTEDKGFFKDKNPALGLAPNLLAECAASRVVVQIFFELSEYLESIKKDVPLLDLDQVASVVDRNLRPQLVDIAGEKAYELGQLVRHRIVTYLTEKIDVVAVDFELSYEVQGIRLPETEIEVSAMELAQGTCTYRLQDSTVSDLQLGIVKMIDPAGREIPTYGMIFGRMSSGLGRGTIPYTLRKWIE